jgi:surface polysaccharide O-acyltransferase-like enzyme
MLSNPNQNKDYSLSSQAERSMSQFNQSKSLVHSDIDAKPVEYTSQQTGDGAGAILQRATATKSSRLFFIDNLRVFLIILVIMFHLAITYGAAGSWYYQDPTKDTLTSALLTILTATDQAFFMGLFFLISAYFIPGSYDRKGAGPFLRDRLLRLGIPLLFYDIVIDPFVAFIATGFYGSYGNFYASYLLALRGIGQGPVWFIEALLFFTVLYALWRLLSKKRSKSLARMTTNASSFDTAHTHPYPTYREMILYIVGLALVNFLIRLWLPIGWTFQLLNFQFPFFPQYISMFILGIIAYRRSWFTRIPDAMGKVWLWVAIIDLLLFPVVAIGGGAINHLDYFAGGLHWQAFFYAFWEAIMCVAMCTGLLVLFRKRFNSQGSFGKFLSANAYTVYILHPLVIVGLAYGLHTVTLYPLLKYGIAVMIAIPCCFVLSALVRRIPYAKRIL